MEQTGHKDIPSGTGTGYETRDASSVRLLLIGFGLLVLITVVLAIVWGLFRLFENRPAEVQKNTSALASEQVIPPEPRLQADPAIDLALVQKRDDSILTTYGWIDRQAGIVRIPVDTAIELLAHSSWPVRSPEDTLPKGDPR